MDYGQLNDKQRAAVTRGQGAVMVLAGPGSGKTTVIIWRVAHLINVEQVDPSSILVITFTKAATEEMRKRFLALSGGVGQAVTFNTFHALFYRILRQRFGGALGEILTEDERREAVRKILKTRGLETEDDFLKGVLNEMSRIQNDLIDMRWFSSMSLNNEDFQGVCTDYEDYKAVNKKIDFDDMLTKCHALLRDEPDVLSAWKNRYKYILADEFQDINAAQYATITRLAGQDGNIFIVGDDDQSIYRFRGAKPEFLKRFVKDYPLAEKIVLDINYRSTNQIIGLCNKVIAGNRGRFEKTIVGAGKSGSPCKLLRFEDVNAEAVGIAKIIRQLLANGAKAEEIAVIYRVNMQARAFTDAFMNANIPYIVKDDAPMVYEHWLARDIRAYMEASADSPARSAAVARIVNKPKRYINNAATDQALKAGGDIILNFREQRILQAWQLDRIGELEKHLRKIVSLPPGEAVKFIRKTVGYDDYVREYAKFRGMGAEGLFEVLDELSEAAKAFGTNAELIAHMDEAVEENKVQKLNKAKNANSGAAAGVVLTTMHGSKGLEFDTVFIAGAVEGSIPYERSKTDAELEEERRLLYVGMTRAKSDLRISVIRNRHEKKVKPSRFLDKIIK